MVVAFVLVLAMVVAAVVVITGVHVKRLRVFFGKLQDP